MDTERGNWYFMWLNASAWGGGGMDDKCFSSFPPEVFTCDIFSGESPACGKKRCVLSTTTIHQHRCDFKPKGPTPWPCFVSKHQRSVRLPHPVVLLAPICAHFSRPAAPAPGSVSSAPERRWRWKRLLNQSCRKPCTGLRWSSAIGRYDRHLVMVVLRWQRLVWLERFAR